MSSRSLLRSRNLPTFVTLGLFVVMFAAGSIAFRGFFSLQNFLNLFIDNAFLLILGVGMTFVIIGGGIDLSVGFVLALSTMLVSSLLTKSHVIPSVVIPLVLAMGTAIGLFMGRLIQTFNLQPFIITLAGLYLGRGLCYVVSIDTIPIADEFFTAAANSRIPLVGGSSVTPGTLIAVAVVLMGLPVARTKIAIYALSGFCSALAGIVFTFYMLSGYALRGKNMEMDAIASVVIGGTLLTGGVGNIPGTVLGVLVYGIIQVLIMFQGTLNSWWTRIVIGFLVFLFCLLQRVFETGKNVALGRK